MHSTPLPPRPRRLAVAAALALAGPLGGCTVITVVGAAASVAVTGASLAVDAAVGTARIAGKAVGATVDAAAPGDSEGK